MKIKTAGPAARIPAHSARCSTQVDRQSVRYSEQSSSSLVMKYAQGTHHGSIFEKRH